MLRPVLSLDDQDLLALESLLYRLTSRARVHHLQENTTQDKKADIKVHGQANGDKLGSTEQRQKGTKRAPFSELRPYSNRKSL